MSGRFGFRVGQGVDVHAFTSGDAITLCGVVIPHHSGLKAHSDGDVALHALCDALLGAASLGDIGKHFPDSDPAWRGADSRVLLRRVREICRERGWVVNNVDVTIICEEPRLSSHIGAMCTNIAEDLDIDPTAASVKATTTERLGLCGRREGIAAQAVATLVAAEDSAR